MRSFSKLPVVLVLTALVGAGWALLALSQPRGQEEWVGAGSGSVDVCGAFELWECYIDYAGVNPDIVVGNWLDPGVCNGPWGGTTG